MKSDIEIAQEAKMKPIIKIAESIGLNEDDIEFYGKYKCKLSLDILNREKEDMNRYMVNRENLENHILMIHDKYREIL